MLGDKLLNRIVDIWLKTEFEGGRHQRRLEKIAQLENQLGCPTEPGDNPDGTCCG
jgi:ribose 5-phosphate isomerase B